MKAHQRQKKSEQGQKQEKKKWQSEREQNEDHDKNFFYDLMRSDVAYRIMSAVLYSNPVLF